jgi:deoxynucleotide monophosphate kinase-like protein
MIIGIRGAAGAGKSTAAKHLIERYGFKNGKFSGALKAMLRTFLRYRGVDEETIERMIEGDFKEVPSPHLNGATPRWAMQSLGNEWGRNCIHRTLWVDTEMEVSADETRLVFDDVRYQNEADAIRERGGLIIEIQRNSEERPDVGKHASEVQEIKPDLIVKNTGCKEVYLAGLVAMLGLEDCI